MIKLGERGPAIPLAGPVVEPQSQRGRVGILRRFRIRIRFQVWNVVVRNVLKAIPSTDCRLPDVIADAKSVAPSS